jgi:hypothetical protein
MNKETLLMATEEEIAGRAPYMEWVEAVGRVDNAVHHWLHIIRDYGGEEFEDDAEKLLQAWTRILRG